jgi:hypothetical protein
MIRSVATLCAFALLGSVRAESLHWSLQPRSTPAVPTFDSPQERNWVRTPIDAFVLAKLREAGLSPAPEADRVTLIRRLSFDLTGLPPSPAEVAAFVRDSGPDAYERLVDRLLASPHYGERWAQHWLDVVRFAESDGFEYDRYRPGIWRFRDYVIESFNADKPFNQFLREQVAGDEIDSRSQTMQVAVGFHRLGPIRRNAGNQKVAFSRNEVLTEMTDAVGMVFLGLTVGCARCHDHKFDDFSQEDYYRLQAFMSATHEHDIVLASEVEQKRWQADTEKIKSEIKALRKLLDGTRGDKQKLLLAQIEAAERRQPPALPTVSTVREIEQERTPIHILNRGLAERPGRLVSASIPSAFDDPMSKPSRLSSRSALADWLVQPHHPLVTRVFVNRLWHHHFGVGIVETPNDFGVNGGAPSHPELLDFLANEFVRGGMRIKAMHRHIVASSTYRQASRVTRSDAGNAKDPGNRLLWRFPRRRLSAEELRDAMLAVSGTLNLKAGGESVVVPVDRDLVDLLYDPSQWRVTEDRSEHNRRSIYLLAKRNLRLPFGQVFDQPDLQTTCPRRESSTHALQSLELLNGDTSNRLARAFAARLAREAPDDAAQQVELAFRLATGRAPTNTERAISLRFLRDHPLTEFALAVFNLNAMMYVD